MKYFIWAITLLAILPARGQDRSDGVTVVVERASKVPERILKGAEQEAARIFRYAGVEITWSETAPPQSNPIVLRVVDRGVDHRLGFALVPKAGAPGAYAEICARCVEELIQEGPSGYILSLGYVIAHELGHLLLGRDSHTLAGIMAAEFPPRGLLRVPRNWYLFSQSQEKEIRKQLQRRAGAVRAP